jgi:hypothetical protein
VSLVVITTATGRTRDNTLILQVSGTGRKNNKRKMSGFFYPLPRLILIIGFFSYSNGLQGEMQRQCCTGNAYFLVLMCIKLLS